MIQWSVLQDPDSWDTMPTMSKRMPINQLTGDVNLYELCPEQGDSILVVNCGTHYEIRYHRWDLGHPAALTDQDIDDIRHGRITWH
jgi:hypothetical protein